MNQNRRQDGAAGADAPARGVARRGLLRGLASGGGVLALVGLAGEAPAADPPSAGDAAADDPKRQGFRVTDHVRWYYRRARL